MIMVGISHHVFGTFRCLLAAFGSMCEAYDPLGRPSGTIWAPGLIVDNC